MEITWGMLPGRIGTQQSLKPRYLTLVLKQLSSPQGVHPSLPGKKPSWGFPSPRGKSRILSMAYKVPHDLTPDYFHLFPQCQACLCQLLKPARPAPVRAIVLAVPSTSSGDIHMTHSLTSFRSSLKCAQ